MKKTIASTWASFEAMVMPKDAPEVQRNAMRDAYYAGAGVMFSLLIDAVYKKDDDESVASVEEINQEMMEFQQEMFLRATKRLAEMGEKIGLKFPAGGGTA